MEGQLHLHRFYRSTCFSMLHISYLVPFLVTSSLSPASLASQKFLLLHFLSPPPPFNRSLLFWIHSCRLRWLPASPPFLLLYCSISRSLLISLSWSHPTILYYSQHWALSTPSSQFLSQVPPRPLHSLSSSPPLLLPQLFLDFPTLFITPLPPPSAILALAIYLIPHLSIYNCAGAVFAGDPFRAGPGALPRRVLRRALWHPRGRQFKNLYMYASFSEV